MNLCECGCGKEVKNRFVNYHHLRINNPMKNPESRKKVSLSKMGDKNPMKNPETAKKVSIAKKKYLKENPDKNPMIICLKNNPEKHPMKNPETVKKIANLLKLFYSKHPDRLPTKKEYVRKKMSESAKIKFMNMKEREKISITLKNKWKNDPEFVRYMKKCCAIKPNKSELKLSEIIKSIDPNFKYTGDFSFFIDGKNPDFVNKKSKKIIELFGNYWHNIKEEVPRLNHFYKNGWECIVIWGNEMKNINEVRQRIEEFTILAS